MKASLLCRAEADVGHLAPDARTVRVSVLCEHDRQGVNQVVKLRRPLRGHSAGQDRSESLKGRLSAVEPEDESLITGQAWEPLSPILCNQAVHLLFLEAALEVSKEPDRDEFMVSELWVSVIAQALKTSL